jgi:hypothetical protein
MIYMDLTGIGMGFGSWSKPVESIYQIAGWRDAVEDTRPGRWGFMVMWGFTVRPEMEARFEEIYGTSGEWVHLFEQDENFLFTELNRECEGHYLTLDYWVSQAAYEKFREKHLAEYESIDRQCEGLTEIERKLATFVRPK